MASSHDDTSAFVSIRNLISLQVSRRVTGFLSAVSLIDLTTVYRASVMRQALG